MSFIGHYSGSKGSVDDRDRSYIGIRHRGVGSTLGSSLVPSRSFVSYDNTEKIDTDLDIDNNNLKVNEDISSNSIDNIASSENLSIIETDSDFEQIPESSMLGTSNPGSQGVKRKHLNKKKSVQKNKKKKVSSGSSKKSNRQGRKKTSIKKNRTRRDII